MGISSIEVKVLFTAWIWVINFINDVNAFLFIIWLDEPKGIYWEKHGPYNKEPFTTSYEMHV